MNQIQNWWSTVAIAVISMIAGAALVVLRARRVAKMKRRIPAEWPLAPRLVANSEERATWMWLCAAFPDHHIMLKLPVTRFTLPLNQGESREWYEMLSGVYCTFSVCSANGRVLGCVDLAENRNISRRNRLLKQTLLGQCGIAYWTVRSFHLPTAADVRAAFLGEDDAKSQAASSAAERDRYRAEIVAMRLKLSNVVAQRRRSRDSRPATLSSQTGSLGSIDSGFGPSVGIDSGFGSSTGFDSNWPQQNSFIAPLDSRKGDLR